MHTNTKRNYTVNFSKQGLVILCALGACILANYPILFFNKSYISPIQGSLYQGFPTVPSDPRSGVPFDSAKKQKNNFFLEDFRGSDVGATAWWLGPITYVQYLSIFKNHEFPFWNRFVGCGLPLFEQGQSQITDPLHWIPVIFKSESWAWDLKFFLSKLIFAIGIGILVLEMTESAYAACLVAFSANFLGYYAYRFNHPAVFSLTYAPWLILNWLSFAKTMQKENITLKRTVGDVACYAMLSLFLLSGSAPKESIVLFLGTQSLGLLFFLTDQKIGIRKKILLPIGVLTGVFLLTAPYWLNFLNFLSKSYTSYDLPSINQFKLTDLAGFFDNVFFLEEYKNLRGPSTNLFILFGLVASLFAFGKSNKKKLISWMLFMGFALIAFGVFPSRILIKIPLINNIQHTGNCFAVAMILFSLILCGHGVAHFIHQPSFAKARILLVFSLIILMSVILSYRNAESIFKIHIKFGFQTLLLICGSCLLAAFFFLWEKKYINSSKTLFCFLAIAFFVAHFRHGLQLPCGNQTIDSFFGNPDVRVSFSGRSAALDKLQYLMENSLQPSRVIGANEVLFPGFNCRYGLESLIAVDAVRNRAYENMLNMVDYPDMGWGWLRLAHADKIPIIQNGINMMNVGYVLAQKAVELSGPYKKIECEDLNIWVNQEQWPRAYWTTDILSNKSETLKAALNRRKRPFAMLQDPDYQKVWGKISIVAKGFAEAHNYKSTGNTTQFSVRANGPGIIVLTETEVTGNWRLLVNGEKREYIMVNGAFKGFVVEEPGVYQVRYTYKPQLLIPSLCIAIVGVFILLGTSFLAQK